MGRHREVRPSPFRRYRTPLLAIVAAVVGFLVIVGIYDVSTQGSDTPVAVPPRPEINELQTGTVASIDSPTTVTVHTLQGNVLVRIIGIADPPSCARETSLSSAKDILLNEDVNLVPDRSLPKTDKDGRSFYHVVLKTQLSYSDQALRDGNAIVASYDSWYRDVYDREEVEAQNGDEGVWGPPCNLKAPTR